MTFCKIVLPNNFDFDEVISNAESIKDYVESFVLQPVFGQKNITAVRALSILIKKKATRNLEFARIVDDKKG